MVWDGTTTIHNKWGNSPTQIAPLLLTFQLTVQADSILVYPLDTYGREKGGFLRYLPVSSNAFSITIDQRRSQTMWVGIEKYGNGMLTSVAGPMEEVPRQFSLKQNYPNPFNPSTTISYSLPKTANVSLRVFNTLGQEIALLVNEQRSPSYYQVQWNANVPSGIYFYRLQAGDASTGSARGFVETKKMILLR